MLRFTNQFFILCLICVCSLVLAAPKKDLWPRWTTDDPNSTATIDYSAWQDFLNHYVTTNADGINIVAYRQVTPTAKKKLNQTIAQLAATNIDRYNRNEQLAYWINLYNALTVATVLQQYPINSVRDIRLGSLFSRGPWDAKLVKVEGIPLSLNDIEHRIVRPIWSNPLTHYALNCASMSCPNLQKTAYTGENVNQLLETAAKTYVNSPRAVTVEGDRLIASSLYVWYEDDFGGNDTSVIQHLKKYANPQLRKQLDQVNKINENRYDWSLNTEK